MLEYTGEGIHPLIGICMILFFVIYLLMKVFAWIERKNNDEKTHSENNVVKFINEYDFQENFKTIREITKEIRTINESTNISQDDAEKLLKTLQELNGRLQAIDVEFKKVLYRENDTV